MVENYAGNLEALLNGFDKSVSIAWGNGKNEKLMNFEIKPEDIFKGREYFYSEALIPLLLRLAQSDCDLRQPQTTH